jgi:hypothetical protein
MNIKMKKESLQIFNQKSLNTFSIHTDSYSMSLLVSFLVFSLSLIMASPNGAPKCGINKTAIQNGMGTASDRSLGYFLDVNPAGNNNWNITIQNSAGESFQ